VLFKKHVEETFPPAKRGRPTEAWVNPIRYQDTASVRRVAANLTTALKAPQDLLKADGGGGQPSNLSFAVIALQQRVQQRVLRQDERIDHSDTCPGKPVLKVFR
jgi:hypothetical protein